MLPLAIANISISTDSSVPIYEQICRAIRKAVDSGDLPPGSPLPTGRELASMLGVGKNSVTAAYTRLVAENYLVAIRRRGTEVSRNRFAPSGLAMELQGGHSADAAAETDDADISYGAQRILSFRLNSAAEARPFATYLPDQSLFPRNQLGRLILAELFRSPGGEDRMGWTRFQSAISNYLRQMRGVHCEPNQVIPITGLESALDLTARVLLDPGHCVLVEEPSTYGTWETFQAAGARVFALPSDNVGADPERAKSPPPRLVYVSPSVSFPLGSQMSENRRAALVELTRRTGSLIFESDLGWELGWGNRVRAIQGMGAAARVFYFGSFCATLGPHLRVAYLVVPSALATHFTDMVKRIGYGPDAFVLSALAGFVEQNEYALHVKTVRAIYARRMGLAIAACRAHIKGAAPIEPSGGFHLTLRFPAGFDEEGAVRSAMRHGLAVAPLSQFYRASAGERGLVLGLGAVPDRNMESAFRKLSEALAQARAMDEVLELAS